MTDNTIPTAPSPQINKEQFDLLYHMMLDALVRITAVENLLMTKKLCDETEIQNEIVTVSASVMSGLATTLGAEMASSPEVQELAHNALPKVYTKKTDKNSN